MINKMRNKKSKSLNEGFTMVELLVGVCIIALIVTIAGYSVISIINNSNENQYKINSSNVKKAAESYILETGTAWVENGEGNHYQCVTVQKLIDMGFFNKDLIGSNISKDRKISTTDKVLVLRDKVSKNIISSEILLNSNNEVCNYVIEENAPEIIADGNIEIVGPSTSVGSAQITVKYELDVVNDNLSNYQYSYQVVGKGNEIKSNFNATAKEVTVNINDTATIKAWLKKGNTVIKEESMTFKVVNGNIVFEGPSTSVGSAQIKIKYNLIGENDNLSNYQYSYQVVGKGNEIKSNFNATAKEVTVNIDDTATIKAWIKKGDTVIKEASSTFTVEEEVGDNIKPRLEIVPFLEYISLDSNDKTINIKAYDNESGLKVGTHTINYIFTTETIKSCDDLVSNGSSASVNFSVNSSNILSTHSATITVPNRKLTTPGNLKLYVCSKTLVDNDGNKYDGIINDELKVYDLEKTISTALFYLPSVLSCSGDSCSLGSDLNFFANGVSLGSGIKFYYLWSQPMNLFSMGGVMDWPFVGAYVKFDDLKKVSGFTNGSSYNEAVNSAEVIFDDGTGTKYVFGYIPLSNMGMCLTTIPCK